ncbi:hypothetical protein [Rhodococcoides yunnanense]|uniref:hypothetical protein n=1 Tax=Rhodococcoides yunnanense TaxID=278209 RepID=UPI001114738F|nr:hypothetical protein [Rhodococcus yunnanensis]
MDEPKRVFRFAYLALRSDVDRRLFRTWHILGTTGLESDPPGAPPLRPERRESDPGISQVEMPDLPRRSVDDTKTRVALICGPGDSENERGVQRGPN